MNKPGDLVYMNQLSPVITHLFIDFDGVLTDNYVYIDDFGKEMVRCNKMDSIGIDKIQAAGVKVAIISTEAGATVTKRAKKLGIDCANGVKDKVASMRIYCADLSNTAFIGNDVNDYEAMEAVGYAIAVADARKEIRDIANYVTKARGGNGAVREACGWLMTRE